MANEKPPERVKTKDQLVIEEHFKDNEALLKVMRRLFFGMPLLEDEKANIKKVFKDKTLFDLMRRRFLPHFTDDMPIGNAVDVWLGAEEMVFGKHPTEMMQAVQYKHQGIEMVKKALALLQDPDGEKVQLEYLPMMYPGDELYINLLARNMFIKSVDKQLTLLFVVANHENMTKEELQKRMRMDSSQ